MSTPLKPTVAPLVEPSTDFPTPDDGEPIRRAPLKIAWLVVGAALAVAAIAGFALGYVL